MKRSALVLFCIYLFCFGLAGCGAQEGEIQEVSGEPTAAPAITPQPRMHRAGETPEPSATPEDQEPEAQQAAADGVVELTAGGQNAQVKVVNTVAHALSVEGATLLYGAVEYQNIGDCDMIIANAALDFVWQGGSAQTNYAPALAEYDVVEPGQTGYLVYYETRTDVAAGTGISMTAQLSCKAAQQRRAPMSVSNLTLAHNYPAFCTLTGTLTADFEGECALNMIYVAFYEQDGSLLGVWNFTRNALFQGGDSKNFAVHLKSLPIENLEKLAVEMKAAAYGF